MLPLLSSSGVGAQDLGFLHVSGDFCARGLHVRCLKASFGVDRTGIAVWMSSVCCPQEDLGFGALYGHGCCFVPSCICS